MAHPRKIAGEDEGTGMMVGLVGCNVAPATSAPAISKLMVLLDGGTITTNKVLAGMVRAVKVVVKLTISLWPGALALL